MPGFGPRSARLRPQRGAAAVVRYRQLATSRAGLLRFEDALSPTPADATWSDSRRAIVARGNLSGFQVTACASSTPINGTETALGYAPVYRGMLEYPAGIFQTFTWAGATSKSVASGGLAVSDTLDVAVPDGATYWVWCRVTGSAYVMPMFCKQGPGDSRASGTGTPPAFGTALAGSGDMAGFAAITALHTTQRPTWALLGDSNMVPQSLNRDALGLVGFSTALGNLGTVDHIKLASSGAPLLGQANNLSRRLALMTQLGVSRAVILWGTNSLSGTNDNSAALIAEDEALATRLAGAGIVAHFMTLPPKAEGGTQLGETARLALNASRRTRAGTGPYGAVYDLADLVETARDSGVWRSGWSVENPPGLHLNFPSASIRSQLQASFQAWAAGIG